jgi:hypothetical protein
VKAFVVLKGGGKAPDALAREIQGFVKASADSSSEHAFLLRCVEGAFSRSTQLSTKW